MEFELVSHIQVCILFCPPSLKRGKGDYDMDESKPPLTNEEILDKIRRETLFLVNHHEAQKPQEDILRHKKTPRLD